MPENKPATDFLYECSINHTRVLPKKHRFDYRVFMLAVDLDRFPKLSLLSKNRFNLFSVDQRDHINTDPSKTLRENLIAWLSQQGQSIPGDSRIHLVTFPRILGYSFNPVSFYYIYSKENQYLTAIAEVTNTYREMKLYHLGGVTDGKIDHHTAKRFYISPFSNPNDSFRFRLGGLCRDWRVNIDNLSGTEVTLFSSIRGRKRPMTDLRLLWFAVKYPLLSILIIIRIHYQALVLFCKKVPYFKKTTDILPESRQASK
ncbi:DUF1365 domain-containing protein [Luteolibacter algae]|uniref:DUF1365 domain-containing protein n=1 Tax=Luteolibacter algae TaxID=454151 RepID=A0ABW5D574_9BACT